MDNQKMENLNLQEWTEQTRSIFAQMIRGGCDSHGLDEQAYKLKQAANSLCQRIVNAIDTEAMTASLIFQSMKLPAGSVGRKVAENLLSAYGGEEGQ